MIDGTIIPNKLKHNIDISQTNPVQHKQIIALFLLMFLNEVGLSFFGAEINVSILTP